MHAHEVDFPGAWVQTGAVHDPLAGMDISLHKYMYVAPLGQELHYKPNRKTYLWICNPHRRSHERTKEIDTVC